MFNRNDPRWERDDSPAPQPSASDDGKEGGEPPPDRPAPPPGRGRNSSSGPPDLDEIWNDFNRKLAGLFGGGSGNGGRNNGRGSGNGDLQPDMKNAGVGAGVIAAVAFALWLCSGFFIVQEGEQAVITRFGQYHSTVGAGFNWRLPYPIERQEVVMVTQIRSANVGGDSIVSSTGLRQSGMLTADENIIEVNFAVQYRLNDARAYLFESDEPDKAVVKVAEAAVREVVGKMTMDKALAEERDQIAPRVRNLMQKMLDSYKIGIEVMAVNMQQSGVRPPEQVKDAFDDVLKADQESKRMQNEAQAYANDIVPRAEGTASRILEQAEAYKVSTVAQAEGDAGRFTAVLQEYQKAPKVVRDRLYLDAMRQVYGNVNKIIVDSRSGANLLYLPLDKLTQQQATATSGNAAAGAASGGAAAPQPAVIPGAASGNARDGARTRERESR
jgi:membrane protease subunit HflK